jgi:hypothetical protein
LYGGVHIGASVRLVGAKRGEPVRGDELIGPNDRGGYRPILEDLKLKRGAKVTGSPSAALALQEVSELLQSLIQTHGYSTSSVNRGTERLQLPIAFERPPSAALKTYMPVASVSGPVKSCLDEKSLDA